MDAVGGTFDWKQRPLPASNYPVASERWRILQSPHLTLSRGTRSSVKSSHETAYHGRL